MVMSGGHARQIYVMAPEVEKSISEFEHNHNFHQIPISAL